MHTREPERSCWATDFECPKCGSVLLCNGRAIWCSFIGGGQEKSCHYGISERVKYDDFLKSRGR